jgi:hypothetical protein
MKHLKTYEELDTDLYRSFMDKYKKSGFISQKSIKNLNKMGIQHEYFERIQRDIKKCYNFFEANDFEILEDILQYAFDECPIPISVEFIWFSINIQPGTWTFDDADVIVSEDDKNLSSKKHVKLTNEVDILDHIIGKIEDTQKRKIEDTQKRRDAEIEKRPGVKDNYYTYNLRALKSEDPYKKMKIQPQISIQLKFDFTDTDVFMEDELWRKIRIERSDILYKFLNTLKDDEIIGRYLRAIGYSDCPFTINLSKMCQYLPGVSQSNEYQIKFSI